MSEISQKTIESYSKAVAFAKKTICPPEANGAYFDPENGEIFCWSSIDFTPSSGMIFLDHTEFKYRGNAEDYISHLEDLVNKLSYQAENRDYSKAEKLVMEAANEFAINDSINRCTRWAQDTIEYAKGLRS